MLLCTLVWGVVVMHHVITTVHHDHLIAHEPPGITSSVHHAGSGIGVPVVMASQIAVSSVQCCDEHGDMSSPAHEGLHDFLHVCLAILAAGVSIGLMVWARHGGTYCRVRWRGFSVRSAGNAVLLSSRSPSLALLCVLRL